jgi:phosphinothricin acetyltransferase
VKARAATPADAAALAAIYNQGIEERIATFETALRSDDDILSWFDGVHPIIVVTDDAGEVIAFARASQYSDRECYRGIFDFAVYTDFAHRRQGAGMLAMRELVTHARTAGAWKLVSRIFVDNEPSRMLVAALGFREVGTHHRHAKLDGRWRDVVVVEKFLAPFGAEASIPPAPPRAPREQVKLSLRSPEPSTRVAAVDSARSLIGVYRASDPDLLDGLADACFASKLSDSASRARFVEVFRAYAAISRDAASNVDDALFTRLGRMQLANDLDAFYEAAFVVKQIVLSPSDAARAADLAIHRPHVLEWMKVAIALPRTTRARVSPGNVASLLMSLALAGCESDDDKRQVADLAAAAKERHRVEVSASVRPGAPTSAPPPPLPTEAPTPATPTDAAPPPAEAAPPPDPAPPPIEEPPALAPKQRAKRTRRVADPNAPEKPKKRARKKA